jgi:hypothetical protein
MSGSPGSCRESYYTFSFSPFMIMLFKEDILQLLKLSGDGFPEAAFQIGKQSLESKIKVPSDVQLLLKKDDYQQREYHNYFMILQFSAGNKDEPYLILDISSSSCNLFLSDKKAENLKEIYLKIKEMIEFRNIYRYFRNSFFYTFVILCDLFFLTYMIFLKDLFEKFINRRIPDTLLLLLALLVNIIFIIPHGKNRVYLFDRDKVNIVKKNREIIILGGVILIIAVLIVTSILSMLKS